MDAAAVTGTMNGHIKHHVDRLIRVNDINFYLPGLDPRNDRKTLVCASNNELLLRLVKLYIFPPGNTQLEACELRVVS